MATCNKENMTLLGFGVQTKVRPGIMSAAQTGLAAGREWRERQKKKKGLIPVQASFAGAGEPNTVTLIWLSWKGPPERLNIGKGLSQPSGQAEIAAGDLSEAARFTFQRAEAEEAWEWRGQALHCASSQKKCRLVPKHTSALLMLISFLFTSACTHGRRTYCLLCHGDR